MHTDFLDVSHYTCRAHRFLIKKGQYCPQCIADWNELPNPRSMHDHQIVQELDFHTQSFITVPVNMLRSRIDTLGAELKRRNIPYDSIL